MANEFETVHKELLRRHRNAVTVSIGFLVLDVILLAIAFFAAASLFRPGDPSLIMGLWIAILVFGLGAFVVRRTKFAAMRLKDIAAVKGMSALLKTLHDTTIQIASIGGAIALMGFMVTILTGEWIGMVRAAGVAAIVIIYGFPFRSAWERLVVQLSPERDA